MAEPQPTHVHHASDAPPRVKVLLVDDQRLTGVILKGLLASESDIEVHCCQEAADAVRLATEIQPAVILQDLIMPGLADGLSMLDHYRAQAATAETPVVVLSANDDAVTRDRARAAGASDYLVKMPGKSVLIACIRRHAESFRQPSAAALPTAASGNSA